jgi:hypothetical protein
MTYSHFVDNHGYCLILFDELIDFSLVSYKCYAISTCKGSTLQRGHSAHFGLLFLQ